MPNEQKLDMKDTLCLTTGKLSGFSHTVFVKTNSDMFVFYFIFCHFTKQIICMTTFISNVFNPFICGSLFIHKCMNCLCHVHFFTHVIKPRVQIYTQGDFKDFPFYTLVILNHLTCYVYSINYPVLHILSSMQQNTVYMFNQLLVLKLRTLIDCTLWSDTSEMCHA